MTTSVCSPLTWSITPLMSSANLASSTAASVAPIAMSDRAMPRESSRARASTAPSMALQIFGGTRPTMPKSMNPTRPSSSTRRLPAWTSAWKISQPRTESAQTLSAVISVPSGFALYARMPSRSTSGTPSNRSMVSTRSEEASRNGFGAAATAVSLFSTRNSRKTSRFWSSLLKSSSSSMEFRISEMRSTKAERESCGLRNSSTLAAMKRKPRSACSTPRTPGFCTFTTTASPERSTAAWTCAMDADANGFLSNDLKTPERGWPNSFSTMRSMRLKGVSSVLSRHFWNSLTYASGKSVGEDAMNWPSLT
mmetsp:Transcript_126750/g.370444  ORF Transcript_126750/g.370444 Transcript_126750/m.370444 type:complete len:309 (-) Transcript_126750:592-1518(-)